MKCLKICLVLMFATVAAAGCERKEPPQEPVAFDPEIDGPPSTLVVSFDEDIIADQTVISRAAKQNKVSALPPKPPVRWIDQPSESEDKGLGLEDQPSPPVAELSTPNEPRPERTEPNQPPDAEKPAKEKRKQPQGSILKRITRPLDGLTAPK